VGVARVLREVTIVAAKCETCPMRLRAEKNPKSLIARIWRFHTKFCPGWKAYQRELAQQGKQQ
jgi:hypothetical protein